MSSWPSHREPLPARKKIGVVIASTAWDRTKVIEGARMAVGLTLRNPDVALFFLSPNGGASASPAGPEAGWEALERHLEAFHDLGCSIIVEKGLENCFHGCKGLEGVKFVDRQEILSLIRKCHVTVIVRE